MMTPKISIVFTSYNHKEFLKEALDGLINQTFEDFELIIIDDCSTDGSQEILKRYSDDPRIRLHLLEKNTGSYVHSSNLGASKAIAEYIIFAQCDDIAEPTQLEILYNELNGKENIGVAFCRSNLIDEENKIITSDYNYRERKFKRQCSTDCLITGNHMINYLSKACVIPNLSAALIKKDIYIKVGGFSTNFKVVADWAFWFETAKLTNFYYVSSCLNNFRQHKTTIRSSIKIQVQILEIFMMLYNFQKRYNSNILQRFKFKIQFSNIWIGYFVQSPKEWVESFLSIFIKICTIDLLFPMIFIITIITILPSYIKKLFIKMIA